VIDWGGTCPARTMSFRSVGSWRRLGFVIFHAEQICLVCPLGSVPTARPHHSLCPHFASLSNTTEPYLNIRNVIATPTTAMTRQMTRPTLTIFLGPIAGSNTPR
jgi:hypothetical protein